MKIGRWKLEKNGIPTPWCLSLSDESHIELNHGFIEQDNMMRTYPEYI